MALFALRDFARHPPPPPTTLLQHPRALAIFDAYPKAKYHFLVLARLPAAGELSERDVDSLASLLRCRDHEARETIMSDLEAAADEVVEMVRDEMVKTTGREWGVQVGFHAVPSMRHLHIHIISTDLVSPALKTKKHYNSFRPDLGFFVTLREVKGWLAQGEVAIAARAETLRKEHLLNTPLTCFKCGEDMRNMPALKKHLEDEFEQEAKEDRR